MDELIGKQFGILTVTRKIGGKKNEYECQCRCGAIRKHRAGDLHKMKSCGQTGCRKGDDAHRLTNSPTYKSWRCLRERCDNVDGHNYHRYGARGVTYDPRWSDFKEFLKDMGKRPEGMTLDRINTNGNYCKENCKWSTAKEQSNNTSNNVFLEYNGERLTVMQWSDRTGMKWETIRQRIGRGWSVEKTLTEPVQVQKRTP